MRWLGGTVALSVSLFVASEARAQYCPSYSLSSDYNTHDCALNAIAGTNPTTELWNEIFDLVSQGPAVWGEAGPTVANMDHGCNAPTLPEKRPARFPCELLKAIAQAESAWKQFCVPDRPADQVGGPERTIISFDCGYGIGQVTSGMRSYDPPPSYDRTRVAGDPTYNLATGTRILAEKWGYTECVGDARLEVIEHWYTATWAYNGLATSNNPNNPDYDANRGVYDPAVGGSRPYQEKVFGRMEHTGGKWIATAVAYPNPANIGNSNKPPALPEPSCASPTSCSVSRAVHATSCDGEPEPPGTGGAASSAVSVSAGATVSTVGAGPEPVGTGGDGAGGDAQGATPRGIAGDDAGCTCRAAGGGPPPSRGVAALGAILLAAAGFRRRATRSGKHRVRHAVGCTPPGEPRGAGSAS